MQCTIKQLNMLINYHAWCDLMSLRRAVSISITDLIHCVHCGLSITNTSVKWQFFRHLILRSDFGKKSLNFVCVYCSFTWSGFLSPNGAVLLRDVFFADVWGQAAIRSCKSLFHSELRQPFNWPQGKRARGGVRLAWIALKLGASFFVLAYGAHYVLGLLNTLHLVCKRTLVRWENSSTLNRPKCREMNPVWYIHWKNIQKIQ